MEMPSAGWRLVQVAELLRRAEEAHLVAMHLLPPEVRAEIREDATATMTAAEIEQLHITLVDGAEIAEQARQIAQGLPSEPVEIVYGEVRQAAAVDLAQGILDPERVLVTARVLDVETGWPALAEGLRVVDIRDSWGRLTPQRMLSAFRGAGRQLVARALQRADVSSEATYADFSAEQLAELARAIDELGRAWRPGSGFA
jgi:hypothetical protein